MVASSKTKTVPLEDDEAKAFHQYLELKHIPHHHHANEGGYGNQQARIRGIKAKAMGQSKGFWDYSVFVPVKGITGTVDAYEQVMIEMKRQKGGVVSPEQRIWQHIYEKSGIKCKICKGCEEAIQFIEEIKGGIR